MKQQLQYETETFLDPGRTKNLTLLMTHNSPHNEQGDGSRLNCLFIVPIMQYT